MPDAGLTDGGLTDGGPTDAGPSDAGRADTGLRAHHTALRRGLLELRDRIGPELVPEFDDLMARHDFLAEDPGPLLHPLGQPLIELPLWLCALAERNGHPLDSSARADLLEATVVGYLHVRVEDDWIDERLGSPTSAPLLSDAFLVRHQALLARLVGRSGRFWDRFEQVAFAYGDAMALERRLHDQAEPISASDFDAILRRSEPLVLPGLAVLDHIDRWDLIEPLTELVRRATRAGQLVTDLMDCGHDLEEGNLTWVVRRLGGLEGHEAMMTNLVRWGYAEISAEAQGDLDGAIVAARALPLPEAEAWLERRRGSIERLGGDLAGALLAAMQERLAVTPDRA